MDYGESAGGILLRLLRWDTTWSPMDLVLLLGLLSDSLLGLSSIQLRVQLGIWFTVYHSMKHFLSFHILSDGNTPF